MFESRQGSMNKETLTAFTLLPLVNKYFITTSLFTAKPRHTPPTQAPFKLSSVLKNNKYIKIYEFVALQLFHQIIIIIINYREIPKQ